MKRVLFVLMLAFAAFISSPAEARQNEKQPITAEDYVNADVEMADRMRADGKIYVVVAIIGVIFAGLIAYTINTDRKITRLEKEIKGHGKIVENA